LRSFFEALEERLLEVGGASAEESGANVGAVEIMMKYGGHFPLS